MGIKLERGFTVIEVMLFFAVTGAFAAAVIVGSGVSISQQRYRDSVNSLKSFIQDQYSQTNNVSNDRGATSKCDSAGITEVNAGQPRGTSDCVILGRFISVEASGTQLSAANVVGYRNAGAANASSDVTELQTNYRLNVASDSIEKETVAWGARIVRPKSTISMPMSLLIVRSPLSGSVMTFTKDGVITNPNELVSSENMKQSKNLCLNPDGSTIVGRRQAIQISAYASTQGAIQIPPESANICD